MKKQTQLVNNNKKFKVHASMNPYSIHDSNILMKRIG